MTLDGLAVALLVGAAIVLLAVVGVRFAGRLGVPGLLLYLGLGLVLGSAFPGLRVENAELATVLGYAALVIILAEGGLTTSMTHLRPVLVPAIALATVGVAVSIVALAVPLVWLAGMDLRTAVLLGAVLAATDAAAVFSVLRRLPIHPRLRSLLEAESGFNDAPVVVLVVAVSTVADPVWWQIPILVVAELVGGALVGVAIGMGARWLIPRLALPAAGLYPIAIMAVLVGAYGAADVLHTSGFMATYVAAVLIGSTEGLPHRRSVLGFAEGLAWAAQIGLFVMLGLLAEIGRISAAVVPAVVAGVALVVVGRPLAAVVSLVPFRLRRGWISFTAVAGLRGAVPIVFAAIPLGLAVPGAEIIFDATLILVIVLTLLQTPIMPWFAGRSGVTVDVSAQELDVESAPLDGMDAALLGITIGPRSRVAGLYVTDLRLPEGAAVSLVVRDDVAFVPDLNTRFRAGDQLLIVATESCRRAAMRRLRAVSAEGRLATWVRGLPDAQGGGRGRSGPR